MRAEEGDESINELATDAKKTQNKIDEAIENPESTGGSDHPQHRSHR
jgi:hypothetical protein